MNSFFFSGMYSSSLQYLNLDLLEEVGLGAVYIRPEQFEEKGLED